MKITMNESELENALEVYINSLWAAPVKVLGFDLSGMRSKEGLTAAIDIEIEGHTYPSTKKEVTEPLKQSEDTNEQEDQELDEEVVRLSTLPKLNKKQQEAYTAILEALNNNPKNSNKNEIIKLINKADELTMQYVSGNKFYQEWYCESCSRDTNCGGSLNEEIHALNELICEGKVKLHEDSEPEIDEGLPFDPSEDSNYFNEDESDKVEDNKTSEDSEEKPVEKPKKKTNLLFS